MSKEKQQNESMKLTELEMRLKNVMNQGHFETWFACYLERLCIQIMTGLNGLTADCLVGYQRVLLLSRETEKKIILFSEIFPMFLI